MKRSKAEVDDRRKKILKIIRTTGDARVIDIARYLRVSEITVRRDLQYFEDRKIIDRYYGGARVRENEPAVRKDLITVCREEIARYAAGIVEDGDILFLNTSSTALMMIPFITARDITVITNNANAVTTQKHHNVRVVLTGGEVYNVKGTLVGEFAWQSISRTTANKTFIGCSGLSIENGMTTGILNEVDLNRAMFRRTSGRAYILADHTKLGRDSSFISCDTDMITDIITDDHAPDEIVSEFKEHGIHVVQVDTGRRSSKNESQQVRDL